MRVIVTGAGGFVGSALCAALANRSATELVMVSRSRPVSGPAGALWCPTSEASDALGAGPFTRGAVVIHTVGRAHVLDETAPDSLKAYREVNVLLTLAIARRAAAVGVRRFIFLSSIKVNGEETAPGQPFGADDPPSPQDPYGQSKLEAEQSLQALASSSGMEIVIVRPPLIYGPGAKANFGSLLRAVQRRWPLPFGAIDNRRSMVGMDNLVDLLVTCIDHPAAAMRTLLVSDGEDVSTPELVRRIALAFGRAPRLFAVPPGLLYRALAVAGRSATARRLCGSLQVDIEATRRYLDWQPPRTLEACLRRTVEAFGRETRR